MDEIKIVGTLLCARGQLRSKVSVRSRFAMSCIGFQLLPTKRNIKGPGKLS